jgi:hypothetical protein
MLQAEETISTIVQNAHLTAMSNLTAVALLTRHCKGMGAFFPALLPVE